MLGRDRPPKRFIVPNLRHQSFRRQRGRACRLSHGVAAARRAARTNGPLPQETTGPPKRYPDILSRVIVKKLDQLVYLRPRDRYTARFLWSVTTTQILYASMWPRDDIDLVLEYPLTQGRHRSSWPSAESVFPIVAY